LSRDNRWVSRSYGDAAAEQAASARAASIVGAHTASQIISTVAVLAADQPAAVAVALAVVPDALKHPVGSSTG
jgi:hypothetical protein